MFTRRCCNPHSLPFSREQRSCAGRSQLDDQPAQLAAACCSAAPLSSHSPRSSDLLPRLFPSAAVLVTPSLLFFLVCFLSWIKSCCVGDTIACAEEGRADPLPTPGVAPPTLAMVFGVNTSPLGGKEGTHMTGRCARQALFVRFGGVVGGRVAEAGGVERAFAAATLVVERPAMGGGNYAFTRLSLSGFLLCFVPWYIHSAEPQNRFRPIIRAIKHPAKGRHTYPYLFALTRVIPQACFHATPTEAVCQPARSVCPVSAVSPLHLRIRIPCGTVLSF